MAKASATRDEIAAALGVSRGTLEKHCMAELKAKPARVVPPPPPWNPSQEQRTRIAILAGGQYPIDGIALDMGVTVDELRAACQKDLTEGAARCRADVIVSTYYAAKSGNQAAVKCYALLEAASRAQPPLPARKKGQPLREETPAPAPAMPALGVKAQRNAQAVGAEAGSPWEGVLPGSGSLQ